MITVYDNDKGANTGGMGAYAPAPVVNEEILTRIKNKIALPLIEGFKKEGKPYKGILYIGLMIKDNTPFVLEFNVRFGDPETQVILPRLETDLIEILTAVIEGNLHQINIKWKNNATVCVVVASGGYPGEYQKGKIINGLEELEEMRDGLAFHAGTKFQDGRMITSGGRVLGITAWDNTIFNAKEKAYEGVEKIYFENMYYRRDIAIKAIK